MSWWSNIKAKFTEIKEEVQKPSNIEQMLLDQQEAANQNKKSKQVQPQQPEEMALVPETGDEDMIDDALEQDYALKNVANSDQKPKYDELANEEKKTTATKQPNMKKKKEKPTIDDLIGAVQTGSAPKQELDIPEHLQPPKKIWVPGTNNNQKPEPAQSQPSQVFGGQTPGMSQQVQAQAAAKMPPGYVSGPSDPLYGVLPFRFNIAPKVFKGSAVITDLLVFANPAQKGHALVGIAELQKNTIYLWFDCISGKVGNTTNKLVRVYFIRDYNEFTGVDLKPNKMLDIEEENKHVIMVHGDIENIKSFYFLEDWMPIK